MRPEALVSYCRVLAALAIAAIFPVAAAAVFEQVTQQDPEWRPRIWVGGGGIGRFNREPPKWGKIEDFDGSFNFCRAYFTGDRFEQGGTGWSTDFPGADNNFSVRLGELTSVHVKLDKSGQPDYVVVRLTDPLLYRCPILHMEDVGVVRFSDEEVESLRAYLLKGGYLIADDFWGSRAWDQWEYEIGRVLPPHAYPIVDIAPNHAVMNVLYDVKEVEQVSNIRFWVQTGSTSERGQDSAHVNFRGIADDQGRLMVVMAHNTDIPDTWEREGESKEYFDKFSPNGYAVGVNIVLYGMTH
jgi:hypothetical protein